MTTGTVKFKVNDDLPYLDTNGVGVNGAGGVFNCGQTGFKFELYCDPACDELSIVELKIWQSKVLTLTGSSYWLQGGGSDPNADIVIGKTAGNYWSVNNNWLNGAYAVASSVGTSPANISFDFEGEVTV